MKAADRRAMQAAHPSLFGPSAGYVFIVTYGRSGSTLLQNLLNGIPGHCIRGENNNALFPLVQAFQTVLTNGEIKRRREAGQRPGGRPPPSLGKPEDPWYGAELIDPAAYGRALADIFVREILHVPPSTRRAGFKEIRFHNHPAQFRRYLNFLYRFFPNARFVFNTRDHAAVARSGWWATQDPATVQATLAQAETCFQAYMAEYPDRCLHLHYDDYVADPTRFGALFEFLDEPYDEALVARVLAQRLQHLQQRRAPGPEAGRGQDAQK